MTRVLISLIFIFSTFNTTLSWGRWATLEDADWAIEFENTQIEVNKDGSYSEIIEQRLKVLKDSAREVLTTRRLYYNSMISSLKVLDAKTINNDLEFKVDPKFIEDKPIASSIKGFDQQNQVLIAFPEVKLNSEIYLKYSLVVRDSPVPGFFSNSFIYGVDAFEKAGWVKIKSQVPLSFSSHDPNQVLKITQKKHSQDSHTYSIDITLKKPIIRIPVDESNIHLDPKNLSWIDVSTTRQWPEMARPLLGKYEEILNQPLPPLFQTIFESAKRKLTPIEKMNAVTSLLAENVNYLGDWRPISGLYIPRNLDEIARTKLADCKDFSASTAAILRKLGMKAHISWIKRGMGVHESPTQIPVMSEFNHAIVRVLDSDRTYWIDPTNFSSFAQGIFPDISDRRTLTLDPEGITLSRTPLNQPEHSEILLVRNISVEDQDRFQVTGNLEMKGVASLPFTGLGLKASKQSIDYGLIKTMGDENRITEWKVDPYDLSSRISKDLVFKFHFLEKDVELKTSAGPAFTLTAGSTIPTLLTQSVNRVSDLFLGTPVTVRRIIHLLKISRLGSESLNCKIESPWINASREVSDHPGEVQVTDSIVIKKSNIPNQELRSAEFARLQRNLQNCYNGIAIIYSRASKNPVL